MSPSSEDGSAAHGPTLVIQIPCHNEEATLAAVLADLPTSLPGIGRIITLVVDDGSSDGTAALAAGLGAQVVRRPRKGGLARAFLDGLDQAIALGADVVVNTDGDGQYRGADIARLVAPILAGDAELVIGTRPIAHVREFSPIKKLLQRLGSWVTRLASGTSVEDAPSGFRAMSRSAAMRLHVFNRYTYTVETIIQAGQKGIPIATVPIEVNPAVRPSRLARSLWHYVSRQMLTIVRIFMTYRPFAFFAVPGALVFSVGFGIGIRFVALYVAGEGSGHVQSLLLGVLLLGTGFFLLVVGLVADLIAVNRSLLERIDWQLRLLRDREGREPDSADR
ncbi:MAG TPA: glycosyltransferase family 2 protein [Gemmatimonadaceae bacterium]|nr:glycosyltransferase family 2 protein [Gemmatimonadaceae bacterium]HRQ78809.1 glycosyltransferase family 2 protein [Gemmatimonadaceae bacterium]